MWWADIFLKLYLKWVLIFARSFSLLETKKSNRYIIVNLALMTKKSRKLFNTNLGNCCYMCNASITRRKLTTVLKVRWLSLSSSLSSSSDLPSAKSCPLLCLPSIIMFKGGGRSNSRGGLSPTQPGYTDTRLCWKPCTILPWLSTHFHSSSTTVSWSTISSTFTPFLSPPWPKTICLPSS